MAPQVIAHYRITTKLGEGGMGEVYRATDTKLKREVALKILPAKFARDPGRMARFHREAEVLASLNHPNIAAIHGVEENTLVMELVEGETLPRPLPVDTALNYARQIAEALEYAHERGVIHRDLKPSNIKVTPEGTVKLLDFGLAKAIEDPAGPSEDPSASPTLTLGATRAGVIMGTAAYMSPEQANGKRADRRADIWSFGAVLYEMLSGKRAFAGESVSDTLAAVLKLDPDWSALPASTPASIQKLIRRCLTKDRKQRLQAIGEARIVLEDPVAESAPPSAPSQSRFGWVAWAVAAAVTLALGAIAGVYLRPAPEARVVTAAILPPEGGAFDFANYLNPPAISPDGHRLVFGARSADGKMQLWIRPLNSRTAQPLAGTEGARYPFWAPDSKNIGFFSGGKLKSIDATGGPPLTLADAPLGHGGSWSREGVIVFAPNETGPLQRMPASGGTAALATTPDTGKERSHRFPWFLPDGRHFLFENWQPGSNDISIIQVASLDSKEAGVVARTSSNAIYADEHLLFLRGRTLMAQPFDAKRLAIAGDAVPVAEQFGYIAGDAFGVFSAAGAGLLAYWADAGAGSRRLTWVDRSGKPEGTLGDAGDFTSPEFSLDRKSLATSAVDAGGNTDLWIHDVARGLRSRFTFDPAIDRNPIWSPDGRSIAFSSNRKGHFDLYRKPSDGASGEELLYADDFDKTPVSWSPDGKYLAYFARRSADEIWVLPLTPQQPGGPLKPSRFLQTGFFESQPRFSPDGRWMAYQSNESQQFEIYVVPFPGPGGKRQISTSGGTFPRWRQDGKEIFYVAPNGRLMAAGVSSRGNMIEVGQVRPLGIPVVTTANYPYDISADGQRFLVVGASEQRSAPLTLVQNWAAGLKK